MEIKKIPFSEKNYVKERSKKTQIVLHHTVSGDNVSGVVAWWNSQSDKIATHYIIDRQGVVYQLFEDDFWAYHLGLGNDHFKKFGLTFQNLNKSSIGIELMSWGPVLPSGDKYYPVKWDAAAKKHLPNTAAKFIDGYPEEYCGKGYRNFRYFEQYTSKQLGSLGGLLAKLCLDHGILTQYRGDAFWEPNIWALGGHSGIWGHVSYRPDKSDPHPQPTLVKLLKNV